MTICKIANLISSSLIMDYANLRNYTLVITCRDLSLYRLVDINTMNFLIDYESHQRKILNISESEHYKDLFVTVGSEGMAKLWQHHP